MAPFAPAPVSTTRTSTIQLLSQKAGTGPLPDDHRRVREHLGMFIRIAERRGAVNRIVLRVSPTRQGHVTCNVSECSESLALPGSTRLHSGPRATRRQTRGAHRVLTSTNRGVSCFVIGFNLIVPEESPHYRKVRFRIGTKWSNENPFHSTGRRSRPRAPVQPFAG